MKWFDLYGNEIDIDYTLKQLSSPSEEVRDRAFDIIVRCVCDRYEYITELAPTVIPALIDLLRYVDVSMKRNILELLESISSEYSIADSESIKYAALAAIREALPLYLEFLSSDPSTLKSEAARLLATFSDQAELIVPEFFMAMETNTAPEFRTDLLVALSRLLARNCSLSEALRASALETLLSLLRITTAGRQNLANVTAIMELERENTPQEVVDTAISSFANPDAYSFALGRFSLALLARDALMHLEHSRSLDALLEVLQIMEPPSDTMFGTRIIVWGLLGLVFPERPANQAIIESYGKAKKWWRRPQRTKEPRFRKLTPEQVRVLSAILYNDKVWPIKNEIEELSRIFGLPDTRIELEKLLNAQ